MDVDTAVASSVVVTIPELRAEDEFVFPTIPGLERQEDYPSSNSQVVTYTGEQSLTLYMDLLASFTYGNTQDEPEPGMRNISIQVFTPGSLGSNLAQVIIQIVPVNDNSPVFDQMSYNGSVAENAPPGSPTGVTVFASDNDVHSGALITYQIAGDNTNFAIDVILGGITTLRPLDADAGDSVFQLTIIASDNDSPPTSTMVNVTIEVDDENDNPPVFSQAVYNTSLLEDALVGSSVLQVFAEDQDSSTINSEFSFRIELVEQPLGSGSGFTPIEPLDLPFEIDSTSGIVSVTGSLDFEDMTAYAFTVIAEDTGLNRPRSGVAQVLIFLLDVNDNIPVFVGAPYTATIPENTTLSTSVVQVLATDRDSTTNGQIEYILEGINPFEINPTSGEITLAQSLDSEDSSSSSMYVFTVIARDMGTVALSEEAQVTVVVLNVNDEPPLFDPATYNFTVSESSDGFEDQVFASDRDGLELTYEPLSGFGSNFEINPTTGILRSSPGFSFDFETQAQYDLEVRVTDGVFSDVAPITISVQDENDLPPSFIQDSYSSAVSENASVGTSVLQVIAFDGDTGSNAASEFSITAGNIGGVFAINPTTGEITVASTLDFDTEPSLYTLVVLVRNIAPPFFNDSVAVFINITDSNDIQPMLFLEPLDVAFIESSSPVFLALSILVTDPDTNSHPLTQCTAILHRGQCGLSSDELALACGSSAQCIDRCAESISVDESIAGQFGLLISNLDTSDNQSLSIMGDGFEMAYQQVVRTLAYGNMAQEPLPGARIIELQCRDSLHVSNTLSIVVTVELRDEFCPEINALVNSFEYVEESDILYIGQQAGFVIADQDRMPHKLLTQLDITLEGIRDSSYESISVDDSFGLNATVTATGEDSSSLTVLISGVANASIYEQVLSTLMYVNSRSEPIIGTRRISVTPFSDAPECASIQLEVNLTLINDNPPELILNETNTLFYVEQSGPLLFAAEAGLQVVDLDHYNLFRMESANVTLMGVNDLGMEHLGYDSDLLRATVSVTTSNGGELSYI